MFDGFGVSFEECYDSFYNSLVVADKPLFISPQSSTTMWSPSFIKEARGALSKFASAAAESEVIVGAELSLFELCRLAASELEDLSEIL